MSASLEAEALRLRASFPQPRVVETRLGPIEVASHGEGPAVLAIHGGMGGYDQSLLLAHCAIGDGSRKVLAVSRPGYLGTVQRAGPTMEEQADLFAALLDTLGITTAAVIAISAGGAPALQFALRHPARCQRLVLVSACTGKLVAPPALERRLATIKFIARIPFLLGWMRRRTLRHPEKAARRSISDPAVCTRTLAHPQAGAAIILLMASTLERLLQRLPGTENDLAQFGRITAYPLERVGVPTLVIHGTDDRVVSFGHAERAARQIPNAHLFAVEHGEHVCLFTHLDEIRARVGAFI